MKPPRPALIAAAVALALPALDVAVARADPRYALVVGVNDAVAPDGTTLPPLRFAEREAYEVRDALVEHGRFDPERVVLVTGGDRDAILAAADTLRLRRDADQRLMGALPSLLVLYFSGHGRDGKLLTTGTPLTSADVEAIKARVGATVLVAIFDTCESTSALPKGVVVGANPLDALPSHLIDARGTVWIASASAGEVALEDERGRVFTRHLVEAFARAPASAVGRTVTDLFEYARARTMRDVDALGYRQTPRIRLNLERTAPLYLSFARDRDARLSFGPDLGGTFLISYEDGTLVERVVKPEGERVSVGAYPGRVRIYRAGPGGAEGGELPWAEFRLASGQEAVITRGTLSAGGRAPRGVRAKGAVGLNVTFEDAPSPWQIGLGPRADFGGAALLGTPWSWRLGGRYAAGEVVYGAALAYGYGRHERYDTWGFSAEQLEVEVSACPGLALGRLRVGLEAAVAATLHRQRFSDGGATRTRGGLALRLGPRLGLPEVGPVELTLSGGIGLRLAPGTAEGADALFTALTGYAGATLSVRLP